MPTISISLSHDSVNALRAMAEQENRSLSNMVTALIYGRKKFTVTEISELPHPDDATPVPVITVEQVEK